MHVLYEKFAYPIDIIKIPLWVNGIEKMLQKEHLVL